MYPVFIGALGVAYLAAYLVALRLPTGPAIALGVGAWGLIAVIGGPLLYAQRAALPQHGLGEAIADFALLLTTGLAGLLAFGIQGVRIGPLAERPRARRILAWVGAPLAPLLAFGMVFGALRLMFAG